MEPGGSMPHSQGLSNNSPPNLEDQVICDRFLHPERFLYQITSHITNLNRKMYLRNTPRNKSHHSEKHFKI